MTKKPRIAGIIDVIAGIIMLLAGVLSLGLVTLYYVFPNPSPPIPVLEQLLLWLLPIAVVIASPFAIYGGTMALKRRRYW